MTCMLSGLKEGGNESASLCSLMVNYSRSGQALDTNFF